MIKLTIKLITILILLFSSLAFSNEDAMDGSVCIAPITTPNSDEISLSNPSGGNREFNFSIQIDRRAKTELDFNNCFELVGLPLDTRHIVTIRNNGEIIESFWFSFDKFNSNKLCLWFNPLYETWSLWKYNDSEHPCKCSSDDMMMISGNSGDSYYLSPFDIELLMDKVNQGNMKAAERLAEYYEFTKNDYKKAINLLRIISKSGDARVQHNLATYLIQSPSLEERKEAVYWSELSAKQGSVLSQTRLARFYDEGEIVEQDYCKAKYWYEKAARSGDNYLPLNSSSMVKISEYYEEGKCVKRDNILAYAWLLVAEKNTHPNSMAGKSINEKIALFEKQLSVSEIKKAKNESEELLNKGEE